MRYLNSDAPKINFQNIVNNKYYVDKSLLIEEVSMNIGTGTHYICVTRPRRFGKTINANMLAAYYTKGYESNDIFDNLKISDTESYGQHQNKYNVVYIDFSRRPFFCNSYYEYIMFIINEIKYELETFYPTLKERTYTQISDMFEATGDSFIFILDEWDSCFYQDFLTDRDRREHLNWLKWLLKDQPYVKLAYMTGVLPIAKYSSGSELNMFSEYNFMNDNVFDRYFGFSEDEVEALCELQNNVSMEELKEWYDGYYFSDGSSLFNPRSVNEALRRGKCHNFWTETGPMNEIAECIEKDLFHYVKPDRRRMPDQPFLDRDCKEVVLTHKNEQGNGLLYIFNPTDSVLKEKYGIKELGFAENKYMFQAGTGELLEQKDGEISVEIPAHGHWLVKVTEDVEFSWKWDSLWANMK